MASAVLTADAGLEEVQGLLCSPASHRVLREIVQSLLKDGYRMDAWKITRAKYKPGQPLRAFFDASFTNSSSRNEVRPIAVTWQAPQDFVPMNGSLEQAEAEIHRRDLDGPFQRLWTDDLSRGIHIQIWPLDAEFPQMTQLSDPAYLKQALSNASHPVADWEVTPVRYRPGERHVLRMRSPGGDIPDPLYAKLYRSPDGARRAFRIANQVVDWLGEHAEGVSGIRPWRWRAEDAVVLYPHAPGVPLSSLLGEPGIQLAGQLQGVGRALRSLHQNPGSLASELKTNTLEQEVRLVDRATQHVQAFLPKVGEEIRQSLQKILELSAELPGETPTFTHSDFKADHLLVNQPENGPVSRNEITIIDFDTCAIADPALDVGKFIADLEWWFVQSGREGVEQVQASFLEGYAPLAPPERLLRARLYQALILIKITARRARLYDRDWARLVTQLVQRAGEILAVSG